MNYKPLDESTAKVGDVVYFLDDEEFSEGKLIFILDKTNDYRRYLFLYEKFEYFEAIWLDKEAIFIKPKTKKLWIAIFNDQLVQGLYDTSGAYESKEKLHDALNLHMKDRHDFQIKEIEIEV